ncbi:MAG: pyruvate kinase [Pseudomonadota bacterium]
MAEKHESATRLLADLQGLVEELVAAGERTLAAWRVSDLRPEFATSATNLAHFLALRGKDRRDLQQRLRRHGLSTLGRSEAHMLATLEAVIATLEGNDPPETTLQALEAGRARLRANTAELFGPPPDDRTTHVMATLEPSSASDPQRLEELIRLGADTVRINCAHDTPDDWRAMATAARTAAKQAGRPCRVFMDLAGPKIRTTHVRQPPHRNRLHADDILRVPFDARAEFDGFVAGCTAPDVLRQVGVGAAFALDDGTATGRVEVVDETGLTVRVARTKPGGLKLKNDKGMNFPGSPLQLAALTEADHEALTVIRELADMVGYSFVQRASDVDLLLEAFARGEGVHERPALVAKIETELAFRNLPEIVVAAAGRGPFGVMIARGDLGVEMGFARLSEVQEEILWLCEAAHVPVIWATEVLASVVKHGQPSRGEFTDAAMAARAEAVMLNKGRFIAEGIQVITDVIRRAERHVDKKTPQLAALRSWQGEG